MTKIIECNNLTHYYGDRKIYENLNFSVEKGKILGLLGKNGTGKTTTINILMGFLQARSGECLLMGENSQNLSVETRKKIGLLIEGHVQYGYMNIHQLERYYSAFFPNWKSEVYHELTSKLKIKPKQRISTMSCGQRSQVALGLVMSQDPDLLILDDFSMGLDPGYRRLFVEYLKDYAKSNDKTVFVTSHIIQDMENLIDDCLVFDYGKVLIQKPVEEILENFKKYTFNIEGNNKNNVKEIAKRDDVYSLNQRHSKVELFSFNNSQYMQHLLNEYNINYSSLATTNLSLEDSFVGLTGIY